jgi:hypothetical protein
MSNGLKVKSQVGAADVPGLNLTPVFANKFTVTVTPLFTRIAFGEFIVGDQEKDVRYHTATTIPTLDATELGQLITAVISQNPAAMQLQHIVRGQLSPPGAFSSPTSTTAVTRGG